MKQTPKRKLLVNCHYFIAFTPLVLFYYRMGMTFKLATNVK